MAEEIYKSFYSPLAHGAEVRGLVGVHAAILCGAVHSLGLISAAFVDSHLCVSVLSIGNGGNLRALGKHILPLAAEVGKGTLYQAPYNALHCSKLHILLLIQQVSNALF